MCWNNAGISGSAEQDFYSTEAWHRIMAVNATGVFFGIKYAIPAMVANGGGSIVNLSSIAGIIGSEHVHMASKTVVRLMTKSVAVQHIRAWLFTIMLNQYANMVRRASREQATVDIEQMSSALVATTDPTASRQLRELERALGRLPGQHGHKPGVFRGTGGSNPVPSSGEMLWGRRRGDGTINRCKEATDGVPYAPAERLEQVPRRPGPK